MTTYTTPTTPTNPTPTRPDVTRGGPAGPAVAGLSTAAWVRIGVIALLFVATFYPNLVRLWLKTNPVSGNANWSHSVVVPVIGLYYLYLRRDAIAATPVRPLLGLSFGPARLIGAAALAAGGLLLWGAGLTVLDGRKFDLFDLGATAITFGYVSLALAGLVLLFDWGLALLFGGLMLAAGGIFPIQNDFIWDVGMVVTLFGVVLTLCGWRMMRHAAFPILFLLAALPWPALVYSKVAAPLQLAAAWTAVTTLNVFGVAAELTGTKIIIPQPGLPDPRVLNVAEACAGMRSLMTFITLGAAVGFLSERPLWQKLLITASAVPIAILCNMSRVSGQGLLDFYVSQEFAEGFAHSFVGLVMLVPAFFLILAVAWVVDNLIVEDTDDEPRAFTTEEKA